jgi:pantothenate kinase
VDKQALLVDLAKRIADVSLTHPTRVAIDGVDAAGKTTLADALVAPIEELGRPVIRATVDGFHRPREERYRRGSDSPEGYYHDSFDYDSARGELLEQLGPGGSLRYRTATFAFPTDQFVYERLQTAQPDAILLFDGIFLMRPELNDLWDFRRLDSRKVWSGPCGATPRAWTAKRPCGSDTKSATSQANGCIWTASSRERLQTWLLKGKAT